jgi:hypothetical protein
MHEFLSKAEQNLYIGAEDRASAVYLGYPVFQKHFDTARFSNRHIVIGSWVIGGVPSGFNFREDSTETTQDDSCFVPCYIRGERQDFDTVRGTNFTDKQRALFKELYGIELSRQVEKSNDPSSSKSADSSGRSGTSGGGGGGGFWGSWFRSYGNNNDGKKEGTSSSSGAGGGSGGVGGNANASGTSNSSEHGKASTSAAEQHKKAAENFRHKAVKNGVFRPRSNISGNVKSTGSSHKPVSRSGGGGRG